MKVNNLELEDYTRLYYAFNRQKLLDYSKNYYAYKKCKGVLTEEDKTDKMLIFLDNYKGNKKKSEAVIIKQKKIKIKGGTISVRFE
jgi:hypothetical protein